MIDDPFADLVHRVVIAALAICILCCINSLLLDPPVSVVTGGIIGGVVMWLSLRSMHRQSI